MSEVAFWLGMILLSAFLWWLAFVATKRMRIGKNAEREEQARRNLERYAREQAEAAAQAQSADVATAEEVTPGEKS